MSKEWLAQLSATAAKRQATPAARPQPAAVRRQHASGRSLAGAVFRSIVRWSVLAAVFGAFAVYALSGEQESGQSWGDAVLNAILTLLAIHLREISGSAAEAIDPAAVYVALLPHADFLPFALPLGFGVLLTLVFLPTVNAYRRRSGLRLFILLLNVAVASFAVGGNLDAVDLTGRGAWLDADAVNFMPVWLWLALLAASFAGWRRRGTSATAPASVPRPKATFQAPAMAGASAAGRAMAAVRAEAPARKSAPTVDRLTAGGSWRRPR
jgi:hypothetical protein